MARLVPSIHISKQPLDLITHCAQWRWGKIFASSASCQLGGGGPAGAQLLGQTFRPAMMLSAPGAAVRPVEGAGAACESGVEIPSCVLVLVFAKLGPRCGERYLSLLRLTS